LATCLAHFIPGTRLQNWQPVWQSLGLFTVKKFFSILMKDIASLPASSIKHYLADSLMAVRVLLYFCVFLHMELIAGLLFVLSGN
jgi:hypothetical protein